MDEMNLVLPPELHSALDAFYTSPAPDPGFAERLEARLRQRQIELAAVRPLHSEPVPDRRSSLMQILRARPLITVIAVILALLLLSGIAYAVAQFGGFMPGIGFVNNVQSVLPTPIVIQREIPLTPPPQTDPTPTVETASEAKLAGNPATVAVQGRKGITLTVEQVAAEAGRLVIAYKISGLPLNLFAPERVPTQLAYAEAHRDEPMPEQVRLPDGRLLDHGNGGRCEGGGDLSSSWLSCQSIYAPLPDGVSQFTLEIKRIHYATPGELPENWVIPIHLNPVSTSPSANSPQGPNLSSQTINGITLRLLKADQSTAQAAFQLGLEWQGADRYVHHNAALTLQDAKGRYFVLTGGPDNGSYSSDKPGSSTMPSLVTTPVDGSSPLTFRLDWLMMAVSSGENAPKLKVDLGPGAKIGQEWMIGQTIQASGYELRFTKARLKPAQNNEITLEFDIQAPAGISQVNLLPLEGGASTESGYDAVRAMLVSRITLPALPGQPFELAVSEILYKVNGPWEIRWQPQKLDLSAAPTPSPAPTRLAPPAPTLVPTNPLLVELQALLSKAALPSGSGWVRQVTQMDQAAPIDTLASGDTPAQPLHSRAEFWYRLDADGYIRTKILIRKSPEGKFLSADVENGRYYFSLPPDHSNISQDIYLARPSYDWDLLSALNGFVADGGTIREEASTVDGKPCRLFVGTLPHDPAQIFAGEPAPVTAMIHSACVDPDSGAVLQVQNQMVYTDGTTRVKDTMRFLSLEKVEALPEEVQQLLDQIIMPQQPN